MFAPSIYCCCAIVPVKFANTNVYVYFAGACPTIHIPWPGPNLGRHRRHCWEQRMQQLNAPTCIESWLDLCQKSGSPEYLPHDSRLTHV